MSTLNSRGNGTTDTHDVAATLQLWLMSLRLTTNSNTGLRWSWVGRFSNSSSTIGVSLNCGAKPVSPKHAPVMPSKHLHWRKSKTAST
eukprot:378333-Amphidinium_carterae.2